MAVNVGSAVAYLELDTSKFTSGFAKARNELKVFGDSTATASQKIDGLGKFVVAVGSTLTKTMTVPLATVGTAAVKVSMDFEKSMSAVKAISGATGSEFDRLRQKAIDLGADTTYSATEVANAMTEMAKAGWSSQQIMDGMQGVLDAASASGEDLATVSTIVADAITSFGLSASDSTKVADLLAQSANAGTISISDLGESFKYIAPVAKTMGFSIEDVTTAVTALSTAGIKGSQAGTTLRTMFARLVKPTDQVEIAMKQLGITLTDSEGNFKSMDSILADMRKRFQDLTPEQQAYYSTVLAGQEGMSGLNALLSMSQKEYDAIAKSMENADGTARKTAETMQDNLAGAVEQLTGSLESAGIVIGGKLTPYIRDLTEFIDDAVDKFNNLDEEQQDNIIQFGLMAAAIGPVTIAGGKLLSIASSLGKGFVTVTSNASLFVQALGLAKNGMSDVAMRVSPLYAGITNLVTALTANAGALGIVTVALAAGVTAYTLYNGRMMELKATASQLTESEQYLRDAIDETYESYSNMKEATQTAIDNANSEAAATQALYEKLQDVTYENGRVMEGKESYAQFIVGELSDALGQEISIVDGQIQGYEELNKTIQDTIEKRKAAAVQEALGDQYTEALSKQTEATIQYNEQLQALTEAQAAYDKAQQRVTEASEAYQESLAMGGEATSAYSYELQSANAVLEGAREKLDEQKEGLEQAEEAMTGYNQTVENYEGLSAAMISGSAEEINLALLKVQEGFLTAETATRTSLENQAATLREKYNEMSQALLEGTPGVTQQAVDSIRQVVEQADAELSARIELDKQTLIQQYQSLGLEAPQALIDSLVQQDPTVQQTVTSMFTKMQNGTQIKSKEIEQLFNALGVDAPTALKTQLANLEPSVQQSAINLLTQLQYAESSKRPEIVAQLKDLGLNMDSSIAGGLQSGKGEVISSGNDVGRSGNRAIEDELKKEVESPDVDDNTTSSAKDEAENARSAMQRIFDNPIVATVRQVVETVTGTGIPSHADGLAYVPFDGYIAELHQGERVLTADENRAYNSGKAVGGNGGDTFNFYNTKPNPYEYARQMKKAKKELLYGL